MKTLKNLARLSVAVFAVSSSAFAASDTWTATSSGNWSNGANWSSAPSAPVPSETLTFASTSGGTITATNDTAANTQYNGLVFGQNATSFVLAGNQINLGGSVVDLSTNAQTISLGQALTAAQSYNVVAGGSLTDTGTISGGFGITKMGLGTLVLTGTNAYTGATTISGGTVNLNFAATGAPATNIIATGHNLVMNGGTLQVTGSTAAGTSQTFATTAISSGENVISAAPTSGSNLPTLALGTLSATQGALVEFVGAAYNSGASSGTTVGGTTVAATANITATANTQNVGILSISTGNPASDYATVGLYDWAALSGGTVGTAQTGTIVGLSQISGGYTVANGNLPQGSNNINVDMTASGDFGGNSTSTSATVATIRFNTNAAITLTDGRALSENQVGGILITPNVGTNNITMAEQGGSNAQGFQASRNANGATGIVVWQNNTLGEFLMNAAYQNGTNSGATDSYTQGGPGTVVAGAVNTYTGANFLDGGQFEISSFNGLGGGTAPATLAAVNLNGGTLVGNGAAVSTDFSGTVLRAVNIGGNGGGLAATAGSTLTVGGLVETTSGDAPLTIGIAASAANGNTVGLLAGTGTITGTITPNAGVFATGTVNLTGQNGYFGGTVIDSGTLEINGVNNLGGGDYEGTTFNGGSLVYAASATGSGSTDISGIGGSGSHGGITFASGGGTINTNGNAVTWGSSVGNGSTGNISIVDTNATPGSLTFSNATGNNYSGTTTIGAGGSLILANASGSATGSGPVVVASTGTLSGTGFSTSAVTVNSGGVIAGGSGRLASGTLTVGSLTLSSGAFDDLYLGSSNTSALIAVTTPGGLVLNGAQLNPFGAGSSTLFTTAGVYNVIQYSGAIGGTGTLSLATAPAGFSYSLSYTGSDVVLTISAVSAPNIWNAANGGDWGVQSNWSSGTAANGPNGVGVAVTLGAGQTVTSTGGNVFLSTNSGNVTVGSILFSNTNSYTLSSSSGQTLTFSNSGGATGSITLAVGSHSITAPVILAAGLTTTVGSTETLTMSGNISGSGTLTVNGPGTTLLSGSNSYGPAAGTVGTVLSSGLLQVGNNNALSTGDVSVTGNNTIQAKANNLSLANNFIITNGTTTTLGTNGNTLTVSGNVTDNSGTGGGSGGLTVASAVAGGTLVLTSTGNNYGGVTTINSGATLQLGNATSAGSIGTGSITDSGALIGGEASGTNVTISSIIGGAGTLTQSGGGTLTLSNANIYTGTTTVSGGSLVANTQLALQDSTVNQNGGSLLFGSAVASATLGDLVGSGNLVLNTNVIASAVALTVGGDNDANDTFSGAISGKGSVTKVGTGTLTLSGAETYLGTTLANGGVLNITNSLGTSGTPSGAITAAGSAIAASTLNFTGATVYASSLTTDSANQALVNISTSNVTLTGALNVAADNGSNNSLVTISSGTVTAASVAIGRAGLNLGGTVLTAGNTSQGIYVNGGTLIDLGNLGVGSAATGDNSTANMLLNAGSVSVTGTTTITNNAGSRYSLLDINGGTFTETDTVTGIQLGGNSSFFTSSGVQTIQTLDAELLVSGTGTLITPVITLNGNTFAGATAANGNSVFYADGGITYLGAGGIVQGTTGSTTPAIYFGASGVSTAATIAASADWSTSIGITLANSSTGTATTIQAADASNVGHNITFSGTITGSGGLIKTGTGTLFLPNLVNTYTGSTTINAGTIQINQNTGLGTNYSQLTLNGGTLRYGSGLSSTATPTLDITSAPAGIVTILAGGATIDTNGNYVQYTKAIGNNGTGGLTLADSNATTGTLELDGANTYTGATNINAGALEIVEGTGAALSNSSAVNLNSAGTLFDISNGGGGQTIKDLSGVAGSTVNLGFATLTEGTANSTTFAGSIVDGGNGGSFYKQGSGTLTLSGVSTYSGATTVAAGKLRVTGSVGSSIVTVGNNTASAFLAGTGTVGGLVTSTTGSNVAYVAPGVNTSGTNGDFGSVGTLHVGTMGFSIGAGTNFDYDINTSNAVGGTSNDLIAMSGGTLSLGGTGIVFNFDQDTALTLGVEYTLINGASGSLSGSLADLSATGIGSDAAVFSYSGGALQVEFTGSVTPVTTYYYTGTLSTDFTAYQNYNTDVSSGTPQTTALSSTSDVFIAANSPSNIGPVANSNITINSLTFNSNGAGATLSGTGTVTIDAASGTGVTDSAGVSTSTETIATALALGANQTWQTTANSTLKVSGNISGAQSLALDGAGTYRLSGSNTFQGLTVGNNSDTPTMYIANTTAGGSATGTTTFTVNGGATIGGKGTSSGTAFTVQGTGTATSARANILVGQTSLADVNTTGVLTLSASGAGKIQDANLTFNIDAHSTNSTELAVGATNVTFGTDSVASVKLTLNVQNEPAVIASYTTYTLIAGIGTTSITAGASSGQYSGLTLGSLLVNSGGVTENQITGTNLQLAFGTSLDQSFYGANSYLVLYQSAGVDDIDVVVVPEPGTWAMMFGGLAMLFFWQRRRSNAKRS